MYNPITENQLLFNYTKLGKLLAFYMEFMKKIIKSPSNWEEFVLIISENYGLLIDRLGFFSIKLWRKYRFERMILLNVIRLVQFTWLSAFMISKTSDILWLATIIKLDFYSHTVAKTFEMLKALR